ncbi:MAG: hypothetical protein AVDCRST_MAG44-1082 [uncultured Sphingomonas sp.]|uniref:DUF4402 domain-containing protein n=1 Tax=uncultured Sphingomonas sp. TaxID=158754 RepID=A0A6J4SVC5_9SPHN|nr:MAG: hypothetical protein AVDCRST_MAG44-1082 [uncultured Sphingomonas sp.]
MDYRKLLVAAALAAGLSAPAQAVPVSAAPDATGRALILVPLTLTKIDDLAFGTIVPSASVSGTVTINATTGARSVTGGVAAYPSDFGHRAYFGGAGSPNQQVIVAVTAPDELTSTTNSADKIPVLALTLDGSPIRSINPTTRTFFFGVGGVIEIGANQPEGLYESTFEVTATYL